MNKLKKLLSASSDEFNILNFLALSKFVLMPKNLTAQSNGNNYAALPKIREEMILLKIYVI